MQKGDKKMADDIIFRKSAFGGFNRDDVLAYISALKQNEDKLYAELKSKDKKIAELTDLVSELSQKAEKQETEFTAQIEEFKASFAEEIEKIKTEYKAKAQEYADSDRAIQEKIGSAMIDVRRYSDLLLHETCDKISTMASNADNATAATLSRVLDISSGIQAFSDKLNSVITDILEENEKICKELTQFKGTLTIPFDKASGKVNTDILTD